MVPGVRCGAAVKIGPRERGANEQMKSAPKVLPDIKPHTPIRILDRSKFSSSNLAFPIDRVAPVVGMSRTYIRKVLGNEKSVTGTGVLKLLDLDAFAETFVPRSRVLDYLIATEARTKTVDEIAPDPRWALKRGHVLDLLPRITSESIQCVATSTPYWGLRIYKDSHFAKWADGETNPFGHEQTPEAFLRHTTEILNHLHRVLAENGSIWWNVMDSFNTRTQIRGNAAEALRAMQGKDRRRWTEHACRRYSSGHAYLKDGEQCLIPSRIAERASKLGFYVKSVVTWAKASTLPEPQESRVSRNLEYVLHLTKVRTPQFFKESYRDLPSNLGGRNKQYETDKLSDVWTLPTSMGKGGHGAQFPIALPARCIALSTQNEEIVLDPFVGSGNAGVAALALGRRFVGLDVSAEYISTAKKRLQECRLISAR